MNVLIADDESDVREGLKYIVDWNELGFHICGEAKNGEEALQNILKLQPDLVLLDIKMPLLSGLEVVKEAKAHDFTGKFIILSGYSDFTYAQTAMRHGVDFYLTKPIEEDELEHAVVSIYNTIKEERKHRSTLYQYREKARDTIIQDIFLDKAEYHTLDTQDLNLNANVYQVVLHQNYNQDNFQTLWDFSSLIRVTNQDHNSLDSTTINGYNFVLLKGEFAIHRFEDLLNHYNRNLQKGSPLDSLFLTYGRKVYQLSQIHYSYEDALSLSKRRFFCDQNQHVLGYQQLPKWEDLSLPLSWDEMREYTKNIPDYIQTHNRTLIAETLKTLEEKLYYSTESVTSIKHFLADVFIQIKSEITNTFHTIEVPFPANATMIDLIEKKYYLYEIIQLFFDQFEICMNAVGSLSRESVLDDIVLYIKRNYRENLKLESIAPLFGYNSSYLGKIFSKKVGESFNSYVDHVRIDKSKELLKDPMLKVYEISEQIGYKNVDYFHKKFKKYVHMSPGEYRKNLLKTE